MRIFIFLLITCWLSPIVAQDYTYVTDRRFKEPHDLIDYQFRPDTWETPGEGDEGEISAGEYAFGLDGNNLFVLGGDIEGQYNVNGIDEMEYGYIIKLINARNPGQQGHLKVILNKYKHAKALVFKQDTRGEETIFFLPVKTKELSKKHDNYFTDRWETVIEDIDSIWGTEVMPYIHYGNSQDVLNMKDSTSIRFIEEITIIDKTKKKRKRKKKKSEEEDTEEVEEDEEPVKKKIKIIKKYYVDLKMVQKNKNGELVSTITRYNVEKMRELEDTEAGPDDERYQILMNVEKKNGIEEIAINLTSERTVSLVEIGDDFFFTMGN